MLETRERADATLWGVDDCEPTDPVAARLAQAIRTHKATIEAANTPAASGAEGLEMVSKHPSDWLTRELSESVEQAARIAELEAALAASEARVTILSNNIDHLMDSSIRRIEEVKQLNSAIATERAARQRAERAISEIHSVAAHALAQPTKSAATVPPPQPATTRETPDETVWGTWDLPIERLNAHLRRDASIRPTVEWDVAITLEDAIRDVLARLKKAEAERDALIAHCTRPDKIDGGLWVMTGWQDCGSQGMASIHAWFDIEAKAIERLRQAASLPAASRAEGGE
jgi:hypothetical protein